MLFLRHFCKPYAKWNLLAPLPTGYEMKTAIGIALPGRFTNADIFYWAILVLLWHLTRLLMTILSPATELGDVANSRLYNQKVKLLPYRFTDRLTSLEV